jgi:putative spermidine/putrescine transport system permease protein
MRGYWKAESSPGNAVSAGSGSGRSVVDVSRPSGVQPSWKAGAVDRIAAAVRPRSAWLALPGMAFLAFFFVVPVLQLLAVSLQDPDTAEFSLAAYHRVIETKVYLGVLQTTFIIALETTGLCLVLGYPLAYWLAMMPEERRRKLILFVMLPFWTSALVKSFSWLVLLARYGVVAHVLGALSPTGHAPELLHGRSAVLMGMVQILLPLTVLTMLPVMLQIDRTLPRAATTLGAPASQAFWRIFFHLSIPGATAAGLLVFISSLGFFIVPALLGGPHEAMIGQVILDQIQQVLDWQFGGALAALLVVSALATSLIYDRLFGLSGITGSDLRVESARWLRRLGLVVLGTVADVSTLILQGIDAIIGLHRLRWIMPTYGWTIILFLMVPTLLVVPMGFTTSRFLEFPPPGFGLHWMSVYLGSPVWVGATVRSFGVAAVTSVLALVLAGGAALAVSRSSSVWGRVVFSTFLGPMIVPAIVTAISLFYLFAYLSLVATNLGLIIGHTVMALPMTFVALVAVFKGYDWRLDQAASTLGANRLRVAWHITVPLVQNGLFAAMLFAFISSFEELTVAIFVSGGLKTTLPKQMWDDVLLAVNPTLAAASVVVLLVVGTIFLIAERFRSRSKALVGGGEA